MKDLNTNDKCAILNWREDNKRRREKEAAQQQLFFFVLLPALVLAMAWATYTICQS